MPRTLQEMGVLAYHMVVVGTTNGMLQLCGHFIFLDLFFNSPYLPLSFRHPKWNATLASNAVSAVNAIITKYWGARRMRGRNSLVRGTSRELGLFEPTQVVENKANMDGAWGLWKNKSKHSYKFEFEYEWYAPDYACGPYLVEVENGIVVSAIEKESGNPVDEAYVEVPSIDGLFNLVKDSLTTAKYTNVNYNSQSGVPEAVFLKKSDDDDESDEDMVIYVRNVEF